MYENVYKINCLDVNKNNEVTNRGILNMLVEAASEHSDEKGYSINTIDKTHLAWLLLNWKLEVFSRPSWNRKLTVKTWPRTCSSLYSNRDFEVYDDNNNLIAIASSKWILYSIDKHTIIKIPEEVSNSYTCIDKSVFESTKDKLKEPENSQIMFEYKVLKRDIDVNNHVNNLNYLDYAYEILPENMCGEDFNNLEIMYKHEAKLGDNLVFLYKFTDDNEHVVTVKNKDTGMLNAIVKLF